MVQRYIIVDIVSLRSENHRNIGIFYDEKLWLEYRRMVGKYKGIVYHNVCDFDMIVQC